MSMLMGTTSPTSMPTNNAPIICRLPPAFLWLAYGFRLFRIWRKKEATTGTRDVVCRPILPSPWMRCRTSEVADSVRIPGVVECNFTSAASPRIPEIPELLYGFTGSSPRDDDRLTMPRAGAERDDEIRHALVVVD